MGEKFELIVIDNLAGASRFPQDILVGSQLEQATGVVGHPQRLGVADVPRRQILGAG